jgi:signal transduction histidine kinase
MRDRANHVLIALVNNPLSGKRVDVALADVFRSSAAIHELPLEIDGDAHVNIAGESLNSMIDNLLGNYAEQARRGDRLLKVTVSLRDKQGTAIAEIQDEQGAPCPWPERLFEPFWSEHGSGRGIGLYQSRQLAQAAGGNLEVEAPADGPLCFTLMLPSSQRGRALHHN